jgi:uncharacterized membrane protein YdjX (TVP38/TMEM64 family)
MMTPEEPAGEMTPNQLRGRLVVIAVVLGSVMAFYVFGLHRFITFGTIRENLSDLQAAADEHFPLTLLVFFLVYVAVTGLSLPVAVWLSLLAGALFGRWVGTGVVSVASTLGATLAMLASRYVLRVWVQARFGHRLGAVNRGIERDGGYYLLSLRLVPAVPFWLINLGMGLTPIRTWTYVLVSWVGMLPGTFLFVNAGTELAEIRDPDDIASPGLLIALILLGAVPLVFRWAFRRAGG